MAGHRREPVRENDRLAVAIPHFAALTAQFEECNHSTPCRGGVSDRYLTTFCNHSHRVSDGKPIAHECYVLPTEMIVAERAGNIARAHEVMGAWKKRKVHKGLKEVSK